jgi:ribonuclease BN (tRNA processing enzyme)
MRLIILGSGTCVPSKRRSPAGTALNLDEEWMLVDSGSGTLGRLNRVDVDYRAIRRVFYTHRHPDHTADLVPFLLALGCTPDFERTDSLELFGPEGFEEFYRQTLHAFPSAAPEGYEVQVREVSRDTLTFGDVEVRCAPLDHGNTPCVGYRFTRGGHSVVIAGDTGYCASLVDLAQDADILALEASFPDAEHLRGHHLHAAETGRVAADAGVRCLILTHMYPVCDQFDMESLAQTHFDGDVITGEDLLAMTLR